MNHLEFAAEEAAGLLESPWERWVNAVTIALGHDLDGDHTVDGYSLDEAYKAWAKGATVPQYVDQVIRRRPAVHRFTPWPAAVEAPCLFPWNPVNAAVMHVAGTKPAYASCSSCGCTDDRACVNCCWWLVVDRLKRSGVCSSCRPALPSWFSTYDGSPVAKAAHGGLDF